MMHPQTAQWLAPTFLWQANQHLYHTLPETVQPAPVVLLTLRPAFQSER